MENTRALVVNGEEIGLRDLLRGYKARRGTQLFEEAIVDAIIRQAARDLPAVTHAELQEAADDFRRSAALYEVKDTEEWLRRTGLSVDDWEARLETQINVRRLRARITDRQVEDYFATNRASLDQATVSQIV